MSEKCEALKEWAKARLISGGYSVAESALNLLDHDWQEKYDAVVKEKDASIKRLCHDGSEKVIEIMKLHDEIAELKRKGGGV